jgi:hypothetical protein
VCKVAIRLPRIKRKSRVIATPGILDPAIKGRHARQLRVKLGARIDPQSVILFDIVAHRLLPSEQRQAEEPDRCYDRRSDQQSAPAA